MTINFITLLLLIILVIFNYYNYLNILNIRAESKLDNDTINKKYLLNSQLYIKSNIFNIKTFHITKLVLALVLKAVIVNYILYLFIKSNNS